MRTEFLEFLLLLRTHGKHYSILEHVHFTCFNFDLLGEQDFSTAKQSCAKTGFTQKLGNKIQLLFYDVSITNSSFP